MANIGIIGAGVMGRIAAWRLLQRGHGITLFDRDNVHTQKPSSAAYTAAGMLAPYSELESSELLVFDLGCRALQLWPSLASSLDSDLDFFPNGSLVLTHLSDKADLDAFRQRVLYKLNQCKPNTFQILDQKQLANKIPAFSNKFNNAIFFPEEACISPPLVMQALQKKLLANQANWQDSSAIDQLNNDLVEKPNSAFAKFDWIIDCRGLGAKRDIPRLRGVRGETILLHAPDVSLDLVIRLMHPRYKLYIAPRKSQHYIIGATQIESDDTSPITVRSALELLSAAYSIDPGFAEAKILATQTNCRPALPNNLPIIEREGKLIRINGLYRHGLLIAPALAEQLEKLIENDEDYSCDYGNLYYMNDSNRLSACAH